jgi:hypothetical protein
VDVKLGVTHYGRNITEGVREKDVEKMFGCVLFGAARASGITEES